MSVPRSPVAVFTRSGEQACVHQRQYDMRTPVLAFTVMNMARRSGTSTRARALARAAEAVARRDAERLAREKSLQAALADLYHAQAEVERIHDAAAKTAAPFDLAIREAVCALEGLGETRAGIAALTGLAPARVRGYLSDAAQRIGQAANEARDKPRTSGLASG